MTTISARLELSAAQAKGMVDLLVASLADREMNDRYRVGLDLSIYEDPTREGQRNGHGIRIHADGQLAGVYATAYDVVVSE